MTKTMIPQSERQAYLAECLDFHEKRKNECIALYMNLPRTHPAAKTTLGKINYHRQQAKWFMRKLSEPQRLSRQETYALIPKLEQSDKASLAARKQFSQNLQDQRNVQAKPTFLQRLKAWFRK